jgi:anti-anti-sigma regulatory factor
VRYVLHAADGTQRPVLAVAAPGTGTRPVVVLADLSAEIDTAAALRADVMLAEAVASRSRIDQAKGALMLAYGLDEEAAFAVLRWHSEHLNIKIRTAAERLCAVLPHPGDVDPRDRLDAVLAHGADLDSPAPGRARPGRGRPAVDRGLTVRRTPPGREVVVSVAGEVDASTVPGLMSGLHEALRAVRSTPDRPGVLVVDLSAVGRLGPLAGLHLGRLRRRCERAQVQLRLVAPAPGGRARSATAPDNDVSPDRPTREDAR